jgi:hypothetical protein
MTGRTVRPAHHNGHSLRIALSGAQNPSMQLRSTRIFLLWLLAPAVACMAPPHRAQAADCPAKPMLTVKDSQDGFAGKTGTIWTIKSDCSFEVARFRGDEVSAPHLKGQLTPEQQSHIAAVLSTAAVQTLPAHVGEPAPVNAHQITIDYGGKTAVVNLGMGDPALQGPSRDSAQRVIEISKAVKGVTGGP